MAAAASAQELSAPHFGLHFERFATAIPTAAVQEAEVEVACQAPTSFATSSAIDQTSACQ